MVVLDTHTWFWWSTDDARLSSAAKAAIENATTIGISSASSLELARLSVLGRLVFDDVERWIRAALRQDKRIRELPLDTEIALSAIDLLRNGLTGDPTDQILLATADLNKGKLITADRQIRAFAPERTIW